MGILDWLFRREPRMPRTAQEDREWAELGRQHRREFGDAKQRRNNNAAHKSYRNKRRKQVREWDSR